MSGDYSRKTFDPLSDFSGVLMQQGRVQLDADWCESVDIVSRRLRAETTDIIGRATVPKETPDGFKIDISGGTLTIGRGRIYVDGLLAENHGNSPLEFDAVLGEERGTVAVPYDEQPYFPNVATVARAPTDGGPYLVYLDVWEREVTYLQNDDLIEKAVDVDTTTRLQTVWQVRVLAGIGTDVTCDTADDQLAGWSKIIRPSDGRLSTDAVGVSTSDDPCVIPPTGGYRGLENRFYRVEIHEGGAAGTATFKWSRDNASIGTSVTAITALDKLTVARVGRDNTLRFSVGDWIEITDDWLEFAQQPGIMRQIADVDDATQIITLTEALPSGIFATDAQGNTGSERHTRITRWDQNGKVTDTNGNLLVNLDGSGSNGLIPVPAFGTSVVLEDGVQITFATSTDGIYRVGDFWCFAARTADASVEKLVEAAPRGIHHHYCRLAMVTFPDVSTDCRYLWPPPFGEAGCDCSVCVTAESHKDGTLTIQRAIDQVKDIGGTVCLGVGVYDLDDESIVINGAKSLCVRGHGLQTVLKYSGGNSAISIENNSEDVTLEDLVVLAASSGDTSSPAVAIQNSVAITLQRTAIVQVSVGDTAAAIPAVGLGGVLVSVLIRENFISGQVGIGRFAIAPGGTAAFEISLLTASLKIEHNTLDCVHRGVSFDAVSIHAFQTRLVENWIRHCDEFGINMCGWVSSNSGVDVRENDLQTGGAGIAIGTHNARIEGNNIAPAQAGQGTDGVVLVSGLDTSGLDHCQILGNRIVDMPGNGIRIANAINSAMIKNNVIEAAGGSGITMDEESSALDLTIENNQLLGIASKTNDQTTRVAGLRVVNTGSAKISTNVIREIGVAAVQNPSCSAIKVVNVDSVCIRGNTLENVGPPNGFLGETYGIDCLGTFSLLDVSGNVVRRNETSPDTAGTSRWFAVRVGTLMTPGFTAAGDRLAFFAAKEMTYVFAGDSFAKLPRRREIIGVHCNLFEGYGEAPLILVQASGGVTLNGNRCLLNTAQQVVADAQAGAIIAIANYLQGAVRVPAMRLKLSPEKGPFTVVGNITSGDIEVDGASLTEPWSPLNVVAS
jgi:hypothetical protein